MRAFAQKVVLIKENHRAVLPKASAAMARGVRRRRSNGRLRKVVSKNGKKNNPAKSLSFPVNALGIWAFSTWSFKRSRPMLRSVEGWQWARRLIERVLIIFFLRYEELVHSFGTEYIHYWHFSLDKRLMNQ
jgi:hypothetical protein